MAKWRITFYSHSFGKGCNFHEREEKKKGKISKFKLENLKTVTRFCQPENLKIESTKTFFYQNILRA